MRPLKKLASFVGLLTLLLGATVIAQTKAHSDFKVTPLGAGTPIPGPGRFGPSTLVEAENQKLLASPAVAQEEALIGNWKLVALQTIVDNEPKTDIYGVRPKGFMMLTREGRLAAMITGETRKAGSSEVERAELYKTLIFYSGKYRVEGKEFVTAVDVSWNEVWNGTEQRRYWRIEDGKLFVETASIPSPNNPGKMAIGRLIFEREK
jgi:hypothetical protein